MPVEFEKVKTILSELMNVPAKTISPSTELVNDLGMDSLDVLKFVIAVEKEFEIQLKGFRGDFIFNVGDAVDFIKKTITA